MRAFLSRRTSDLLALAVLALLALIFFWPVTLNRGWIPRGGGDLVSFLWPMYSYAARSLWAGRLPLWNPTQFSGLPFAADNQSGLFYPLNLLTSLLAPNMPYQAMEWLIVFHFWLAGAGMYFLLRILLADRERLTGNSDQRPAFRLAKRPSALISAIAYMFSDVFVTHVGNLNIVAVSAWLPAALACLHLALTRRSVNWALSAGVILGMAALAGHGQMTLMIAGALGLYGLWQIAESLWHIADSLWHIAYGRNTWCAPLHAPRSTLHALPSTLHALRPTISLLSLTFLIALGLSAIATLPAVELTRFTGRARLDYATASQYSLPWAGLAGLFSPLVFGRGAAHFWGPWDRVELGYLGVLPILFAGLAPFKERRGLTAFLVLLGIFGLFVALGANTPVHRLLYLAVPGFAQLRVPARFILLTDFAIAVLAGLGLERYFTPEHTQRWGGGVKWGALLLIIAPAVVWVAYRSVAIDAPHRAGLLWGTVIVTGLLLIGLLLITHYPLRSIAPLLAVIVLSADLLGHGAWVEVEPNDPTSGFQHWAAIAFLQSQPGPTRIDNASGAWAPASAMRLGLEDIGGLHNPLALVDYQTYLGAVGDRGASPLYNFLNTQFVIADKGRPPGGPTLISVFDEDPAVDVYLNTNALPRVSLAYSATVVPDGEAAFGAIHTPGFDPLSGVIVQGDAPALASSAPPASDANLYYLEYEPETFTVIALNPAPAYVVFSEVWYPGWRAWVDGVEAPIHRANFAFRAVYLPKAGEHKVVMRFEPVSWKIGLGVTVLTLLGIVMRVGYSASVSRSALRDQRYT